MPDIPHKPEQDTPTAAIAVFHDESGDFGHDDWVFLGLLWVPRADVAALAADLRALREGFGGEIHFYRFPRNFGGEYGAAARTARAWFERWRDDWGRRMWFNVLAVNRRHTLYDGVRFGRPDRAYLHFTALALRTGLAAFFRDTPAASLAIWSDERSGRSSGVEASPGADAFANALVQELVQSLAEDGATSNATGAAMCLDGGSVRTLSGERAGAAFTPEQELLQLTDLLLGAAGTAIDPRATAATKRHFARELALVMEDVRVAPRPSSFGLHGHFLVSYFPGPDGRLTGDGPIGVRVV